MDWSWLPDLVLQLHLLATLFLCGVIWFVQVVHYPLFAAVPAVGFTAYEARHVRRTTWIVGPPMLLELATALALVAQAPEDRARWLGMALLTVIWASTAMVQVPLHGQLRERPGADAIARLVRSNWVRTTAWSGRAVLAVWVIGPAG